MIRAVLARISGLRLLIVGVALFGALVSISVFFTEGAIQASKTILGNTNNPFSVALSYAILSSIPFIGIAGFLSYRVNRHIRRLSRGRYEPPAEEDY